MSSFDHVPIPFGGHPLLEPSGQDQLRLSRRAASRHALTAALAERRATGARPTSRSVWLRARRALTWPRPA